MTLTPTFITNGFVLAGLANLSVLISSRFFTNEVIPQTDPAVMSNFGMLMIVIWGLAYISVAKSYASVKWLVGVFAIEKLIYGVTWLQWITSNSVAEVYEADTMAGAFFSSYGIVDWTFCVFFSMVFVQLLRARSGVQ